MAYRLGRVSPGPNQPTQYSMDVQKVAHTVVNSVFSRNTIPEFTPEDISIEKIFSGERTWIATLSADRIRTIIVTGDVIPARSANSQAVRRNSFTWAFEKTANLLRNADLTVINLETPLMKDCIPTQSGMKFCGDVRNVDGLVFAGIDVASLANNHAGNYGIAGLQETEAVLRSSGISVSGVDSQPVVKEIRGKRFAFLAYNDIGSKEPGIKWADERIIQHEIHEAGKSNDIVIVSFHWGAEYQRFPDLRQVQLAHLAVDAGADLVLGNHPHWLQPPEIYNGALIMYAHGNFIFDQEWSEETKLGVIGKYTFYDRKLIDVEFFPVRIMDYGQPYILQTAEKLAILDKLHIDALRMSK